MLDADIFLPQKPGINS